MMPKNIFLGSIVLFKMMEFHFKWRGIDEVLSNIFLNISMPVAPEENSNWFISSWSKYIDTF